MDMDMDMNLTPCYTNQNVRNIYDGINDHTTGQIGNLFHSKTGITTL